MTTSYVDAEETCFESFYDDDSGVWSLRRISTRPPPATDGDAGE